MKIIFLDFDGVLNSEKYIRSCGHYGVVIDPSRMKLLSRLINSTDAKIVLSTSWREHWDSDKSKCDKTGLLINEIFAEHRLSIHDKTPKLPSDRESEIKMWLEQHEDVTDFVVFDDAFLSADYLQNRFVKTSNYRNGLSEENIKEAIEILMKS